MVCWNLYFLWENDRFLQKKESSFKKKVFSKNDCFVKKIKNWVILQNVGFWKYKGFVKKTVKFLKEQWFLRKKTSIFKKFEFPIKAAIFWKNNAFSRKKMWVFRKNIVWAKTNWMFWSIRRVLWEQWRIFENIELLERQTGDFWKF